MQSLGETAEPPINNTPVAEQQNMDWIIHQTVCLHLQANLLVMLILGVRDQNERITNYEDSTFSKDLQCLYTNDSSNHVSC